MIANYFILVFSQINLNTYGAINLSFFVSATTMPVCLKQTYDACDCILMRATSLHVAAKTVGLSENSMTCYFKIVVTSGSEAYTP